MTYRIRGLEPRRFRPLFDLSDEELRKRGARRVRADEHPGFPCRVTLQDAAPGETLVLLNHVSNDVDGPFRTSYGIYIREKATDAACFRDEVPPVMTVRRLALRCFDAEGMLVGAEIAERGDADGGIRQLLERPAVASIHAHSPAFGCFIAKVERDG